MKLLICLAITAVFAGIGAADAGQSRGNGNARKSKAVDKRDKADTPARVHVVFQTRDRDAVRAHYRGKYKSLPPGLQKKLVRGGQLPPGWQKKIEPFPSTLDRTLVALPGGYKRGVIDGHAVVYDPLTHAIMDIFALF